MKKVNKLIFSVPVLALAACASAPDDVLSPQQMADVLADLQTVEGYYAVEGRPDGMRIGMEGEDSLKLALMQGVLAAHGLTYNSFEHSLDWYGRHLDRYEDVCDLTIETLDKRRRQISSMAEAPASSSSLWPSEIAVSMSGHTGRDTLAFCIPATKLAKGDRVVWSFSTTSLVAPLDVAIAVDYDDGSTALLTRKVASEGRQQVEFQTDSTLSPQLLYGYIAVPQRTPLLIDSVSITSTPLSKSAYYDIHTQHRLSDK